MKTLHSKQQKPSEHADLRQAAHFPTYTQNNLVPVNVGAGVPASSLALLEIV